jgi:energy-converting hydrogenase B subunit D
VAMTEAAIGSGLTTFLFFFVLGRVRAGENDGDERG